MFLRTYDASYLEQKFALEPKLCRRRRLDLACILTFIAVIAAALFVRLALAFEFPIPWPDEAAFLSQSFGLSQTGSLFVPALNPSRILMWMPPGYMVVMAAIFKIFGYSFAAARWTSAILFVASFGLVIFTVRDLLAGWRAAMALLCVVAVAATPYVIVIANVARMDALYMFAILLSLLAVLRQRPVAALAIVAATGVIHFNAIYFMPPYGAVVFFAIRRQQSLQIGRTDIVCTVIAALAICGYGLFALLHWRPFVYDISWQFRIHAQIPFRATATDIAFLALLSAVPLVQLAFLRTLTAEFFLSAYGAGFFLLSFHGDEMWYRFAFSLGLLLTGMSCLVWWARAAPTENGRARQLLLLPLFVAITYGIGYYAWVSTPGTASLHDLLAQRVISKGSLKQTHAAIRLLPK